MIMSEATLYLIQSSYQHTPAVLKQLSALYSSGDQVILLGDAVLHAHDPLLRTFAQVMALNVDAENLTAPQQTTLQLIDYDAFATTVLRFKRCISLK